MTKETAQMLKRWSFTHCRDHVNHTPTRLTLSFAARHF
jgi:hypothetical protein